MAKNYVLKPGQEAFQVVEGKHAGRSYLAGVVYSDTDIPSGCRGRFCEKPALKPATVATAGGTTKKEEPKK